MRLHIKDRIDLHGKDIVIIGDGPMGFIAAIKLQQCGVKNITLVGPRIGAFTRSGDYKDGMFEAVAAAIEPLPLVSTSTRHIKEIERQLHPHALNADISIIKKKLIGFGGKRHLLLADENAEQQMIKADVVFDCSGTQRAAIKLFNAQSQSETKFSIQPEDVIPHKAHAFIRALVDVNDMGALVDPFNFVPDPLAYTLAMAELHQLGWRGYAIPLIYANTFSRPGTDIRKANIYLQVPEEFIADKTSKTEKILQFAKVLLKLYNNGDRAPEITLHAPSKKYPAKPVVSGFYIDPHQTTPGCYLGDEEYPAIFHLGDATADLPFLLGSGLKNGLARLTNIIKTFTIQDGAIRFIDLGQFDEYFKTGLREHQSALALYRRLLLERPRWVSWMQPAKLIKIYTTAYEGCSDKAKKEVIRQGLERLKAEYAAVPIDEVWRPRL